MCGMSVGCWLLAVVFVGVKYCCVQWATILRMILCFVFCVLCVCSARASAWDGC